uniref:uncharacterized protein LOC122610565 n=1 Tax=Erigeron canadensis TaxID=72917 RepID=UPI001CB94E01|nr:uncharacterized protein LOC122610565 [Erigeron canadensis]
MDKDQSEMQNIGFFGVFKETFKAIFSWKKIFAQITVTFILPLSFVFFAHIIFGDILKWGMAEEEFIEDPYYHHKDEWSRWVGYWVFKILYMTFFFLFYLLSTAAIVYTIANVYTGSDVTFKKVVKIVPKVWKRLAFTFVWSYVCFFIYNAVCGIALFFWASIMSETTFDIIVFWVMFLLYGIGFVYITAVWQLASVVSVLESSYGWGAMKKGNALIRGKRWLSWFVFFALYFIFVVILIVFYICLWNYTNYSLIIAIVCLFLLTILFLVAYVAQTMLYLVCKSHHGESIDKVGLSTQLEGYLDQTEPVSYENRDIELGRT